MPFDRQRIAFGSVDRAAFPRERFSALSTQTFASKRSLFFWLHPAVSHPSHVTIPRLESEPRLGDFLTGTARSQAAKQMLRISDFIDRYPKDGRPVTEPTVAYLGYTREYFFAAFVCKDKTPRLIRAHMLARDSLGDDDFVEVMLDTFDDQRGHLCLTAMLSASRAMVFTVNRTPPTTV